MIRGGRTGNTNADRKKREGVCQTYEIGNGVARRFEFSYKNPADAGFQSLHSEIR